MIFGRDGRILRAPGRWVSALWLRVVDTARWCWEWREFFAELFLLVWPALWMGAGIATLLFIVARLYPAESPHLRLEQLAAAEVCAPRRAGHGCLCTAAGSDEVWVDGFCDAARSKP